MPDKPDLTLQEWAAVLDAVSDAIDGLDEMLAGEPENQSTAESIDLLYGIADKITHYRRGVN